MQRPHHSSKGLTHVDVVCLAQGVSRTLSDAAVIATQELEIEALGTENESLIGTLDEAPGTLREVQSDALDLYHKVDAVLPQLHKQRDAAITRSF